MFNNKLIIKTSLFFIFFVLFLIFFINPTLAEESDSGITYADPPNYTLEVPLGNTTSVTGFDDYIKILFRFSVGLIAGIALFLIVVGGIIWILAAGNEQRISKAKTMITSAIIGLIIALSSYVILYTINPNLVSLEAMQIPYIEMYFGEAGSKISLLESCSGSKWGSECKQTPCGNICHNFDHGYCRGAVCEDSTKPFCGPDLKDPLNTQKCYAEAARNNLSYCETLFFSPLIEEYGDKPIPDHYAIDFSECVCSSSYNSHIYEIGHDTLSFQDKTGIVQAYMTLLREFPQERAIELMEHCSMPYYDYGIPCREVDATCISIYEARVDSAENLCQKQCEEDDPAGLEDCKWEPFTVVPGRYECPVWDTSCEPEYETGFCTGPLYPGMKGRVVYW